MTSADWGMWAATALAAVQAIYAMLSYHASRGRPMPSKLTDQNKKVIIITTAMSLLCWMGVGYSLYDRRSSRINECIDYVGAYGIHGPLTFYAAVDTSSLLDKKDEYKLILAVRVNYADIDPITDTALEKSGEYIITGELVRLSTRPAPADPKLRLFEAKQYSLLYYVIMLPHKYTSANVISLADVERLGGKIIGRKAQTVPLSSLGITFKP
ncbi:MAG: hypothetical protein EPN21_08925 [Methylococcaceae bacterium]|nr:MAG: hypothetical protein EPN21_08925 [Methylococcaceae bacterium]